MLKIIKKIKKFYSKINEDELDEDEFEYDTIDCTFLKKEEKNAYITSNLLYHPDITTFKKVFKRHTIFFKKFYKYPIGKIHLMKPKINKNKIFDEETKYYISIIQKLFDISETLSVRKLKKFDGDVYKTILFG